MRMVNISECFRDTYVFDSLLWHSVSAVYMILGGVFARSFAPCRSGVPLWIANSPSVKSSSACEDACQRSAPCLSSYQKMALKKDVNNLTEHYYGTFNCSSTSVFSERCTPSYPRKKKVLNLIKFSPFILLDIGDRLPLLCLRLLT